MQDHQKHGPTIRLLYQQSDGSIVDHQDEWELPQFAATLPAIGDTVVHPGVATGKDRGDPANRDVLTIVGRVFNPKDNPSYIGLIVKAHKGTEKDSAFL